MTDKIPLLLYSGGLDSTLMLNLALHKSQVEVMYVECNGGPDRSHCEHGARSRAKQWFYDESDHDDNLFTIKKDHKINLDNTLVQVKGRHLIQPLAWIIGGLMAFNKTRHSELQVGYILGDTAPIYKTELETTWRNAYALMHWCRPEDAPAVRFPLIEAGYDKLRVLTDLPHGLADKIWVCELPERHGVGQYRYCKTCQSCRTHLHALLDYKAKYQWDYGAWVIRNRERNQALYESDIIPTLESVE